MASHLPSPGWGTFPPEEGVVQMAFTWSKKMLAVAAMALFGVSLAFAQQTVVEEGKRKVRTKVTPTVPELARRMNITGKVKIEVVIAPDGRIKSSRAMGGHPVLVQS